MPACTFFGHRDAPQNIYDSIYNSIKFLIETKGVDVFYVGNNGSFDKIVKRALDELHEIYPIIKVNIVLAYIQ